ncbi:hypothetical protein [Amycolatopsis sp. WGS_07]|uniref:hypothetical protein n=1 Tax=Amycolatopsis sp. WGS_07 TaxID=3076764 RepID=UPI0038734B55
MSSETAQAAADQANREGRLHPSQRTKLLDGNFWVSVLLVAAGIAGAVLVPLKLGADSAYLRNANAVNAFLGKPLVTYWSLNWKLYLLALFPLALAVWFGRVAWRRLAEVRGGKLDVVAGWTHDYGHVLKPPSGGQHALYLYEITERITFTYLVVRGKSYRLDHDLKGRVLGGRTNAAILTPRSKILVNVVAA